MKLAYSSSSFAISDSIQEKMGGAGDNGNKSVLAIIEQICYNEDRTDWGAKNDYTN